MLFLYCVFFLREFHSWIKRFLFDSFKISTCCYLFVFYVSCEYLLSGGLRRRRSRWSVGHSFQVKWFYLTKWVLFIPIGLPSPNRLVMAENFQFIHQGDGLDSSWPILNCSQPSHSQDLCLRWKPLNTTSLLGSLGWLEVLRNITVFPMLLTLKPFCTGGRWILNKTVH